jgi:anti-anti-sigma regulatory factor
MKADVSISQASGNYKIVVIGRANFNCSPSLRDLAKNLNLDSLKGIQIDFTNCESMDSTFMGVLAMLSLKARESKVTIDILNISDFNKNLLDGLGLSDMFTYSTGESTTIEANEKAAASEADRNMTVLEAHETLMEVNENNVNEFKNVVDLLKKDLNK